MRGFVRLCRRRFGLSTRPGALRRCPTTWSTSCCLPSARLRSWQVLQRLGIPGAGFCRRSLALHPVQVESAAWITELKNTQSGLFYLLAILFFTEFIAAERQENRVLAHRWYGLSIVCGALALASKSSTVILPVVLVLCLWWLDGRWQWRRAWSVAPFVLLAAASSALSVWTQGQDIGGRENGSGAGPSGSRWRAR